MTIALLRTAEADAAKAYEALEFTAARLGVRIVGFVDLQPSSDRYRGLPILDPFSLASAGVELVIAASSFPDQARDRLVAAGVPPERLLSYETERDACRARFEQSRFLVARESVFEDGRLDVRTRAFEMRGLAVEPMPSSISADRSAQLAERAFGALEAAIGRTPLTGPFQIGRNWGGFLRSTRPRYFQAVADRDARTIESLLSHCLRNEMTSGILGGREAYDAFAAGGLANYSGTRLQFNVWRHSLDCLDPARLASPMVGDPYGVWVDSFIVHPNTFLNDTRAALVADLAAGHDRPVIVEIGGGFGGFGQQLLAHGLDAVYVDFDLPDNLIVASYLLEAAHPDKRVLRYDGRAAPLDAARLDGYDIVLMPHFMLPQLADRVADVLVNFISLSEMDHETIAEYLQQIDRVCGGFFYHENLIEHGEAFEAYPVSTFPALRAFRRVYTAPSRWPFFSPTSPFHCHGEQLFVRRDIETAKYLGAGTPPSARRARRSA